MRVPNACWPQTATNSQHLSRLLGNHLKRGLGECVGSEGWARPERSESVCVCARAREEGREVVEPIGHTTAKVRSDLFSAGGGGGASLLPPDKEQRHALEDRHERCEQESSSPAGGVWRPHGGVGPAEKQLAALFSLGKLQWDASRVASRSIHTGRSCRAQSGSRRGHAASRP